METDTMSDTLTINAADLIAAITAVAASADKSSGLPILKGVLLTADADGVRLVATDKFRLTVATVKSAAGELVEPLLIPAADLVKWAAGVKIPNKDYRNNIIVTITADRFDLILSTSVEGAEDYDNTARIKLFHADYPKWQQLGLNPAADTYTTGTPVATLGFNPKLLGECSTALAKAIGKAELKSNPVKLHLPNHAGKAILMSVDTDAVSYLTALMPMRVS